jgi:hypothetical protein
MAVINSKIRALRLSNMNFREPLKVNQFSAFIFRSKMLAKIDFS